MCLKRMDFQRKLQCPTDAYSNKFKQNYLNLKFFLSLLTYIKHTHTYMYLCLYTDIKVYI